METTLHTVSCRRAQTLRLFAVLLILVLGMLPNLVRASGVTILLQEGFNGESYPPSGWVDDSYGGWYHSSNGNGAADGSAVMDFWSCYNATLTTPTLDASAFAYSSDTAVVEFDLWMEADYYSANYGGDQLDINVYNSNGSTTLLTLNSSTDFTYDNSASYGYSSDPLTDASYWRHYTIGIPQAYRTANLQIGWHGSTPNNACGGNAAIDNVFIHGTHQNVLGVTPTSLAFGGFILSQTSDPLCVTLSNENPTPISISNITIGGSNPGDYAITSPTEVVPAGSLGNPSTSTICVTFTPHAGGASYGTLTFSTNADSPTDVSIPLTGKGLQPIAYVTPTTLFNKMHVRLGRTDTAFVIVSNVGAGNLIISPQTTIIGLDSENYSVVRIPSQPIIPGGVDTIFVAFAPTYEGASTASMSVISNASNDTVPVTLKGNGVLQHLVVTPALINFDSVAIGESACQSLTLSNPGSDTLTIVADYLSSADVDFSFNGLKSSEMMIPPGSSRTATVCFAPVRNGTRVAALRIATNIPATFEQTSRDTSASTITIIGIGNPVGRLAVNGSSVVDTVALGVSDCRSDSLLNVGTTDLVITAVTISGLAPADFQISGLTLPDTLHAGASQGFNLCATPSSRGYRSASLTATGTSGGVTESISIPLAVVGVSICATASPSSVFDRAKTLIGTMDSTLVSVQNCGDVTAVYSAQLNQTNSSYRLGASTSAPVASGASAQFIVYFTPRIHGSDNGTITITAPGVTPMTVQLKGYGGAVLVQASQPQIPDTKVGSQSSEISVQVMNTGDYDWTPGAPSLDNDNFLYVASANNPIPVGQQGTLTFKFSPSTVGTNTTTVTFPTSSPKETPALSFTLSGQGLAAQGVATVVAADGFSLAQNYPNPFNPSTEINFSTPISGQVRLELIDLSGRPVRTILDSRLSAGEHNVKLDASGLASGVYQYRLSSGATVLTRQMVLAK